MMTAKMFYKKSWWRSALALLLIMCMVTSMVIMTVEDAHASVTLTGLACSAVVGLTIGALLAGSGVPMTEENSVPLINAFYWGCDAEQLAIIESFNPGQAIGDLFDAVSNFFTTNLSTGNLFYSKDPMLASTFPALYSDGTNIYAYENFTTNASALDGTILGCPFEWKYLSVENGYAVGDLYFVGLNDSEYCIADNYTSYTIWLVKGSNGNAGIRYSQSRDCFLWYPSLGTSSGGNASSSGGYNEVYPPGSDRAYWPDAVYYYLKSVYTGDFTNNSYVGLTTPISEYLPTSTDTEKVLTTTTPVYVPQTWEQLWDATPEIVRTGTFTGTGGTTDPDNPDDDTDIVVGPATGTITGDGTGTGVFEGIGKWLWEIPILAEIYALGQQIRSIVNDGFGISSAISSLVSGIQGTLQSIWTTVTDILSPVTGILTGVQSLVTSVGALASGEVPAELQDRIYQFSGQIFDILSWDEMSRSMAALENMGSGYGEPPVITLNLHRLVDTAQGIGHFKNTFDNEEVTVIDFEILEDERFQFMGMTIIEWIRLMFTVSMIWYTAWYVWEKIVPDDAVR